MQDPEEAERRAREAKRQAAQDEFDLNAELTDTEERRPSRFLAEAQTASAKRKRELHREERVAATLIHAGLQRFSARLAELERASILALRDAEKRVEDAERSLDDIRRRAMRDAEGRLVYGTADRTSAFYDDGREVPAAERELLPWSREAPTWNDRLSAAHEIVTASQERDAIAEYRDRLDTLRERAANENMMTSDELNSLVQDTERMPARVAAHLNEKALDAGSAMSPRPGQSAFIPKP